MKKYYLTATLVAIFAFTSNAQEQGDIRIGAGLAIGTKAKAGVDATKLGFGINLGAEYLFTDVISLAPSYTFFFKSNVAGLEASPSAINIDARYYFGESGLYGLAGFSYVKTKTEGSFFGTPISDSVKEGGLNIGAGIMYPISDNLFANGQVKYQTPGEGQLVINAGIAFAF